MLSIIVSSYQQKYYDQLVKNINETIGDHFLYEIIQIWNPDLMSITKAYNIGAKKSQYENLLFLHEDIIFHTQNWGEKLLSSLNKDNTGVIGIAGSSYVPSAPSSWTVATKYNFINILQGNKQNTDYTHLHSMAGNLMKALAVDGVFLAIKKEKYLQIRFDENLKGFHGYDLDFSLRTSKKFQNYVIDDILIQHFSGGNLNKIWFDTNIAIKLKLGSNFNIHTDSEVEKDVFNNFLYRYFTYYLINRKNILFTLKFYPKKLTLKHHLEIMKKYLSYIRHSGDINKKINLTQGE
ncbi:glycosyltransferase [Chryseobacterium jejuense]|uniref:Glycosyltransferase like family protein n=1 Tax=Chryseobacterium jejuense TaxID=445960 RepID=A0A2X2XG78_CHRJE|nr:glycosyltransferase [Chryseobacterium jejuense]SDI57213.1 Glycosyltransferase like family protein [Chryseobacterium jejuense]SQB47075.1 Uncharacterised protein [Chryseobacterium jejuense]